MKTRGNKMQRIPAGLLTLFCLLGLVLAGCSSMRSGSNDLKAAVIEPAADAGFIANPELQVKREDLPFHKVWIKPDFDKSGYKALVVAPVNTEYVMDMDWLHKAGSANWVGNVKKDLEKLAIYFKDEVVKQFTEDPNKRFQIIEDTGMPEPATLRLELALIEVNPSQPVLHAAGWLIPGGGTAAGAVNKRTAAFEGRLRDLQTGEVVATFADRDMQDVGPIDLTRLTWYGPAKGIMDQWAKQFVQIANRQQGESVTDPTAFTLRPF
jgi:Protein of unknown function (DUF3313)